MSQSRVTLAMRMILGKQLGIGRDLLDHATLIAEGCADFIRRLHHVAVASRVASNGLSPVCTHVYFRYREYKWPVASPWWRCK